MHQSDIKDDEFLNAEYGTVRSPDKIDTWEDRKPDSLAKLDQTTATCLKSLEELVQTKLLKAAAKAKNYLWVMDELGHIFIAVEELALQQPDAMYSGYPRRRGCKHPSEDKKLGHPTLLSGGKARIAGELAFDIIEGKTRWVLNANSGRYCRSKPPSDQQVGNIAKYFKKMGINVFVDYD